MQYLMSLNMALSRSLISYYIHHSELVFCIDFQTYQHSTGHRSFESIKLLYMCVSPFLAFDQIFHCSFTSPLKNQVSISLRKNQLLEVNFILSQPSDTYDISLDRGQLMITSNRIKHLIYSHLEVFRVFNTLDFQTYILYS